MTNIMTICSEKKVTVYGKHFSGPEAFGGPFSSITVNVESSSENDQISLIFNNIDEVDSFLINISSAVAQIRKEHQNANSR